MLFTIPHYGNRGTIREEVSVKQESTFTQPHPSLVLEQVNLIHQYCLMKCPVTFSGRANQLRLLLPILD